MGPRKEMQLGMTVVGFTLTVGDSQTVKPV